MRILIGGDYRTFIGGNIFLVGPVMRIAQSPRAGIDPWWEHAILK